MKNTILNHILRSWMIYMVSYQKRHKFKLCPADEREGLHVEASADGVVVRARVDRRCGDPRSTPVPPGLELRPGENNPIRGTRAAYSWPAPHIRLPSSLRIRPSLPMRAATRPWESAEPSSSSLFLGPTTNPFDFGQNFVAVCELALPKLKLTS